MMGLTLGLSLGTLFGSTAVSDPYEVAGFSPPLVFDFAEDFYRTGGSTTTFDAAMTHNRSGNATMVDSDGLLKWAPHNMLLRSEEFGDEYWSKNFSATVTADTENSPFGNLTADTITSGDTNGGSAVYASAATVVSTSYTVRVYAKALTHDFLVVQINSGANASFITFNLTNGDTGTPQDILSSVPMAGSAVSVGGEWYLCTLTFTAQDASSLIFFAPGTAQDTRNQSVGGTILLWGAHLYRSDLGGVVNNPDTGNSYVPTTSAARYLPRRGHHIYNGAEWVNEGVLVESEARVNLAYYSNDISNTAVGWTAFDTLTAPATGVTGVDGVSGSPFKLIAGSSGTGQVRSNKNSVTSGQDYALCAILKDAGDGVYASISGMGISGASENPIFDLVNGTVDVGATTTVVKEAGIEPWGDGWYFCWARVTAGGTAGVTLIISNSATDNSSAASAWTGDNTSGYYVAYVGCEQTSGMPSVTPIPTSGSTVTRSADTITVPSANLPYDATAMSIQMDGAATGNTYIPTRWYLDANNAILQDIGSTDFTFTQEAAGVVDTVTGGSFTSGINTPFNIASRHGSTFINGAIDVTALTANTTPTALPDLSATNLQLGFGYMGTIKTLRMWSDDLGDDGLEEATA